MVQPAATSEIGCGSFHEPTRRLFYFRAFWGWWATNKRTMILVDARGKGRTVYPGESVARLLVPGLAAPILVVPPIPRVAPWSIEVDGRRFPGSDLQLVRRLYGDGVTWRRLGDLLLGFVDRVLVAAMSCLIHGGHGRKRGEARIDDVAGLPTSAGASK